MDKPVSYHDKHLCINWLSPLFPCIWHCTTLPHKCKQPRISGFHQLASYRPIYLLSILPYLISSIHTPFYSLAALCGSRRGSSNFGDVVFLVSKERIRLAFWFLFLYYLPSFFIEFHIVRFCVLSAFFASLSSSALARISFHNLIESFGSFFQSSCDTIAIYRSLLYSWSCCSIFTFFCTK